MTKLRRIAALFVDSNSPYKQQPFVDCWDQVRDAMLYRSPYPVVAHPPCTRWCKLAPINHARHGTPMCEDGGMFEFALNAVRRCGGVLEHPAQTMAWAMFNLPKPKSSGGWLEADDGFVAYVEQGRYGHQCRKGTWLFVSGVSRANLPELRWGYSLKWDGPSVGAYASRGRVEQSHITPPAFLDVLVGIARSVE